MIYSTVVTEGSLKWEKADLPPVASECAVEFDGKTSLEVKANPLLDVPKITAEAWVKQTKISIYKNLSSQDYRYLRVHRTIFFS